MDNNRYKISARYDLFHALRLIGVIIFILIWVIMIGVSLFAKGMNGIEKAVMFFVMGLFSFMILGISYLPYLMENYFLIIKENTFIVQKGKKTILVIPIEKITKIEIQNLSRNFSNLGDYRTYTNLQICIYSSISTERFTKLEMPSLNADKFTLCASNENLDLIYRIFNKEIISDIRDLKNNKLV